MLVCVWDSMDAAITRLRAERSLEEYTVLVTASPYADSGQSQRVVDGWLDRIKSGVERAVRVSFRTLESLLKDGFGAQIGGKD